jgi:hypothetical protein
MSGIGCSSKTPAYFLGASHGFNSVHGRMPSVATGANAANRALYLLGVSGDGDSLSIGLGQFMHALRRNLDMLYIIENNGVYGLTKGQFSASADVGSKAKKGEVNKQPPIDPVQIAMALGGTFVARSFSGDKEQLVPLIKAGVRHRGFALIDVLSPCVTFNDHEDSTKSYAHAREFTQRVVHADFVPPAGEGLFRGQSRRGHRLHSRSSTQGGDRHGPPVRGQRRAGHARRQRHDESAFEPAASRGALPGRRRSRLAAEALPLTPARAGSPRGGMSRPLDRGARARQL